MTALAIDAAMPVDDLVEAARAGDGEAFGLLFEHYHPPIYQALLRQTHSADLADDLASETFFKALHGIKGFRSDAEYFGPWLVRISLNLVSDHFRSRSARFEDVTDDMTPHEEVVDGSDVNVLRLLEGESLHRSLARLPVNQRRCVVLRFLQQRSIPETARLLECTEGAVKQLQLRGVRSLARLMRGEPEEVA